MCKRLSAVTEEIVYANGVNGVDTKFIKLESEKTTRIETIST